MGGCRNALRALLARQARTVAGTTTFLAASALALSSASVASASVQATIYASPTGSGTACTSGSPCSLSGAQTKVEGMNSGMTGDIIVQLAGGTYRLSSTMTFTGSDSATNGHSIIWEAAPDATPIITGGAQVTGWTEIDTTHNIWEANIPSGVTSYDLWVNGTRATLSQGNASTLFPSGSTVNSTGYVVSGNTLQGLSNPDGMELVLQGAGWVQNTCPVSSVTGTSTSTTVTVTNPCYEISNQDPWAPSNLPVVVQNEKEWINGANQWAYNTTTGKVYFEAPSGVSMSGADAELGNLTTLVSLSGTESSPVTGVQFSGISFENTTLPATVTAGMAASQADIEYPNFACDQDSGPSEFITSEGGASVNGTPFEACTVPMAAAVEVDAGRGVSFSDDTFTHLGTSGITLGGGTQNSTIVGSTLTDIGGNPVQVGQTANPNESDSNLVDSNDTVDENLVNDPAVDYHGGVGIWAGYTANLTIENNTVENAPYTGISTGWGWGSWDTVPSIDTNNQVVDNYVSNVTTDPGQYDGGGIYNLGPQPNGIMSGNYTALGGNTRFGLYLDEGSIGWTVRDNVVTGDGISWMFDDDNPPSDDNCGAMTFINNYAAPIGSSGSNGLNSLCTTSQSDENLSSDTDNTNALGAEDRSGQQFPYKTYSSTTASYQRSNGVFTINAAGADVWGSTDQYGSIYTPGGAGIQNTTIVKVASQANSSGWAKAGIMLRNSIPGAGTSLGYAAMFVTPSNGVVLQWDGSSSGGLNEAVQNAGSGVSAPVWLKLVRSGNSITGYYSTDGTTYTSVGSGTLTGANTTEDVGLFADAQSTSTMGQAVFSDYSSVNSPFSTYSNTESTLVNDANGDFTINSSGADVWGSTDQYGSIYVPGGATASNTTTVELTSQDDSAAGWVKAGIMLRNSIPGAGSSLGYCILADIPDHGIVLDSDSNSDGQLDDLAAYTGVVKAPVWLRLVRTSTTGVTGYYSTDGTTWTSVGSTTCSGANATEDVGVFADSDNSGVTGHATFSNFSSVNSPYKTFTNTQSALVEDASGNFTIDSAGEDIWGSTDQYASIYDPSSADASSTTTVKLNTQADSASYTKAGIMLRNNLAGAGSSLGYCALGFIPDHGVALMSDTNSDGQLDTTVGPGGLSAPIWLRLTRTSTTGVTGYYSTNGTTWTSVGTATCSGANTTEDVGLFATSNSSGVTGFASFSNFSISG